MSLNASLPLYEKLAGLNRCPVCGANSTGAKTPAVDMRRRFECGAVFAYSKTVHAIVAADACPAASHVQAAQLSAEAMEESRGAA